MQASIDAVALKPFTRALTCLSKYGDDLSIYATPDTLSLSTTNSSLSAYCRFRYGRQFFVKYHVGDRGAPRGGSADDVEEVQSVTGQLLTKSLLSILKHRTVEKTVDRCDLSIVEGASGPDDDEDHDTLESKLIVRLHCKHGIVKTHRLPMLTPTSLMAPGIPEAPNESRLTIGPKAMKDMIDHFPSTKGSKSDPQLVWEFGESDVQVRSLDTSVDAIGNAQLSTELTISVDEFDHYDVFDIPISIAFHLREFNATIAYAESMSLALDLRFTDPAAPLFIDVESDSTESLFVVSTSQVPGAAPVNSHARTGSHARKRAREDDAAPRRRAQQVVERTESTTLARRMGEMRASSQGSMLPPPSVPVRSSVPRQSPPPRAQSQAPAHEPLFLPSSQMSAADEEALRASGLGVDRMDADEFNAMFEDEGVEVGDYAEEHHTEDAPAEDPFPEGLREISPHVEPEEELEGGFGQQNYEERPQSLELFDDTEMGPTQNGGNKVCRFILI
ncbi:hypothetical protein BV25DRAFT_1801221 [Artomyces pyxidatus]|uniref:Uncharacterized protein n=1 Tax=Artomyces pyxidatus TaxID=48021 RepID=A0ACB8T7J9_9AGAM|nr:hypothetical protein BV25DRAFT_1801221 [Artomyces pyxidatus]